MPTGWNPLSITESELEGGREAVGGSHNPQGDRGQGGVVDRRGCGLFHPLTALALDCLCSASFNT